MIDLKITSGKRSRNTGVFFIPLWRMRAENIPNIGQLLVSFSESATYSILGGSNNTRYNMLKNFNTTEVSTSLKLSPLVMNIDNKAKTTSLIIAEVFGKNTLTF